MVIIFLSLTSNSFLTISNLMNVGTQISMIGIISVGMTFVIISGGFDLSVGALTAMCGAVALTVANATSSLVIGLIRAIIVGVFFGLINGLIYTKIGVNSLITTLATGIII